MAAPVKGAMEGREQGGSWGAAKGNRQTNFIDPY